MFEVFIYYFFFSNFSDDVFFFGTKKGYRFLGFWFGLFFFGNEKGLSVFRFLVWVVFFVLVRLVSKNISKLKRCSTACERSSGGGHYQDVPTSSLPVTTDNGL